MSLQKEPGISGVGSRVRGIPCGACKGFPIALMILSLLVHVGFLSGCKELPVIGDENYNAPITAIQYEMIDDEFDGILYRQVNDFTRLMARSDVPLLVVFYDAMADINIQIIPDLEELAIVYHDRLQIVWIDVNQSPQLAEQFSVDIVPQFSIVDQAVLKRSLIGYSEMGRVELTELIEPYVTQAQAD